VVTRVTSRATAPRLLLPVTQAEAGEVPVAVPSVVVGTPTEAATPTVEVLAENAIAAEDRAT
jgi:hypothetical protein